MKSTDADMPTDILAEYVNSIYSSYDRILYKYI